MFLCAEQVKAWSGRQYIAILYFKKSEKNGNKGYQLSVFCCIISLCTRLLSFIIFVLASSLKGSCALFIKLFIANIQKVRYITRPSVIIKWIKKLAYLLIVCCSASIEVDTPALTDIVKSSISSDTSPSYPIMLSTEKNSFHHWRSFPQPTAT